MRFTLKLFKQPTLRNICGCCLVLLHFYSPGAQAGTVNCAYSVDSITFNLGTIIVQRDKAVGSNISSDINGPEYHIADCTITGTDFVGVQISSPLPTTSNNAGRIIFDTSLPGAGFALGTTGGFSSGSSQYDSWIPAGGTYTTGGGFSQTAAPNYVSGVVGFYEKPLIQFVKTSNQLTSGTVSGLIGYFTVSQTTPLANVLKRIPVYVVANLQVVACSVTTPNVTVPLDPVVANSFSSVGTTKGDQAFTIGLNCDAGARINASLGGAQNADTSDPSVLALNGAGSAGVATGVGIQLLYNNTPLALGQRIVLRTSDGGQELPPNAFVARYFQTNSTVTPGDANTTATLTLTYQ